MLDTYASEEDEICALLSIAIGTLEYENNGLNYEELSIAALEEVIEHVNKVINKAKEKRNDS